MISNQGLITPQNTINCCLSKVYLLYGILKLLFTTNVGVIF